MEKRKNIQSSAIARLFSAAVVKELSTTGRSPLMAKLVREAGLEGEVAGLNNVSDLFDKAFEFLRYREHRHEYIYKAAITKKILLGKHSLNTASMVSEFRVGKCKADVVILNGTATAYEIKSERDKLSRLDAQVLEYLKVFATVNVIVGENHVEQVLAAVPKEVGVMTLGQRYRISVVREGVNDPERTDPNAIFGSITQLEAARILTRAGRTLPNVPNTERYEALRKLFLELTPVEAHFGMVEALKETRNLLSFKELLEEVPESLQTASLSVRLRKRDHDRLVASLKTPVFEALNWG